MSEQGDLLAELREQGLVDDGVEEPAHGTSDPEEREGVHPEQTELSTPEVEGRIWKGAEQLRPYLARISDLKPTEGNPFKGKGHVARLKGSLERFGQVRAVLADSEDGVTIRAGHHLTLAAEELGWTHVAAIQAEFNDRGEAIAYLMADNQLAHVGNSDADQMAQLTILEEIGETNLQGTGWDLDAVETLRSNAGFTPVIAETEPWGGEAAETAEEAAARAKALEGFEPHKEIPLLMTLPQHEQFKEHVRLLQSAWSIGGVMETILRALAECYDREAAPVGVAAHEGAAPATAPSGEGSSEPGGVTEPGAAPIADVRVVDAETGADVTSEYVAADDDIPL